VSQSEPLRSYLRHVRVMSMVERLLAALDHAHELSRRFFKTPSRENLKTLMNIRQTVHQMAFEYSEAIAQYREVCLQEAAISPQLVSLTSLTLTKKPPCRIRRVVGNLARPESRFSTRRIG